MMIKYKFKMNHKYKTKQNNKLIFSHKLDNKFKINHKF
jgi:hypothetical protein